MTGPLLSVELRYLPILFPDRSTAISAEIRNRLALRCSFPSHQFIEALKIQLVGPNMLEGEAKFRP